MRRSFVGALLSLLLLAPAALARQEGTVIAGTITQAGSGSPLVAALVRIPQLELRATSTADGRYRLVIPAGRRTPGDSVRVEVSRLGMEPVSRMVVLRGDTVVVDFQMTARAIALESIAATGVGGEERRERVLAGRAAGVTVMSAPAGEVTSAPTEGERAQASRQAGVLTAGILDDFSRQGWRQYQRFMDEHPHGEAWSLEPREVLRVRIRGGGGRPLRDHPVVVRQGERRYELRTRADGTIRLFPRLEHRLDDGEFTVTPQGGAAHRLVLSPALLRRGAVTLDQRIAPARGRRPTLDIGLLIDATGSMQDEMSYLQAELRDIIARVQPRGSPLEVRISVVYYRDRNDQFVTLPHPFGTDVDATVGFLAATRADGGGDYPEEMNEALRVMMGQEWSDGPAARMLFLVADAPPHEYADARYTYHHALADAARQGVSIFPVASSGVDRPTEYLMRAMAVMTGGKYLFLTDHSGVGNPHLTPDQPFDVHRLNDLMVREISAFVTGYYPELRGYAAR
jgi:hypothetical protein